MGHPLSVKNFRASLKTHCSESGLRRLKPFLKEGLKNPKNFQKINDKKHLLKVLRILKELFQKFLKRGEGAEPLPDNPQFLFKPVTALSHGALDSEQAIVLGHPLGSAGGSRLNEGCSRGNRDIRNGGILGLT